MWLGAGQVGLGIDRQVFGVEYPDPPVQEIPNISQLNLEGSSVDSEFQKSAARPAGGARGVVLLQLTLDVAPLAFKGSMDFELPKMFHLNVERWYDLELSSQKSKFDPCDPD